MKGYLLDTHVWLWIMQGARREVSKGFFGALEEWQRQGIVSLSPVSCWETGLLVALGRLKLDLPIETLWERDTGFRGFGQSPLTAQVLVESTRLPGEMHRDPADRMLVATARLNDLTLVTRDRLILQYAKAGSVMVREP